MSGSLMPITDEMRMIYKDHYNGTVDSLQTILTCLKEKGYSQAQAVRLIKWEMKVSLVDADKIVMHSIAWSGEKEGNEWLRENFRQVLLYGKPEEGPEITILSSEMGILKEPNKDDKEC